VKNAKHRPKTFNETLQVDGFFISYFAALKALEIAQQNIVGNSKNFERLFSLNDVKEKRKEKRG